MTKLISNNQKNIEANQAEIAIIRKELRDRCDKLQAENDVWKSKYYVDIRALQEEIFTLKADNAALRVQLSDINSRGWVPEEEHKRYQ